MAGAFDPRPTHGGWLRAGDFPIGFKAAKVIYPHKVHQFKRRFQAAHPPRIAVGLHLIPTIERVAPPLPSLAKVVWRNPCDHCWRAVRVEVKQILVAPHIATVGGDENWQVAYKLDPALGGIAAQRPPLLVKHPLCKLMVADGRRVRLACRSNRSRFKTDDGRVAPFRPRA